MRFTYIILSLLLATTSITALADQSYTEEDVALLLEEVLDQLEADVDIVVIGDGEFDACTAAKAALASAKGVLKTANAALSVVKLGLTALRAEKAIQCAPFVGDPKECRRLKSEIQKSEASLRELGNTAASAEDGVREAETAVAEACK